MKSQTLASEATPQAGGLLTAAQVLRAQKLIELTKPAYLRLQKWGEGPIRSGCTVSQRCAIENLGGGDVGLWMAQIPDADTHGFWEGIQPGVNQFNTRDFLPAPLARVTPYTPAGVRYWNGVGQNTTTGTFGLLTNEITNALAKPTISATAGIRKITISWTAVSGANGYRLYWSSSGVLTNPIGADNAGEPIEVSGDATSYVDNLESGDRRAYLLTPMIDDAEGFFSNAVSETAL